MTYVVHVDHPTNCARIHTTDCHHYLNRKGDSSEDWYWTRPFTDLASAQAYLRHTEKKDAGLCQHCCG